MNRHSAAESTCFTGYRFPPEVILLAVRWYLHYGFSYCDVEELLAERGIDVDHVYRAADQHGQVIDVYVSKRGNIAAAHKFFTGSLVTHGRPREVTTDLAAPLLPVMDELIPEAMHHTKQYSNNRIKNDHGRLEPDCGRKQSDRHTCAKTADTRQPTDQRNGV